MDNQAPVRLYARDPAKNSRANRIPPKHLGLPAVAWVQTGYRRTGVCWPLQNNRSRLRAESGRGGGALFGPQSKMFNSGFLA